MTDFKDFIYLQHSSRVKHKLSLSPKTRMVAGKNWVVVAATALLGQEGKLWRPAYALATCCYKSSWTEPFLMELGLDEDIEIFGTDLGMDFFGAMSFLIYQ